MTCGYMLRSCFDELSTNGGVVVADFFFPFTLSPELVEGAKGGVFGCCHPFAAAEYLPAHTTETLCASKLF